MSYNKIQAELKSLMDLAENQIAAGNAMKELAIGLGKKLLHIHVGAPKRGKKTSADIKAAISLRMDKRLFQRK